MLRPEDPAEFPDPSGYDAEGLLAFGGDLSADRILAGYAQGVFPWFSAGQVPIWWSPDPRAVLTPERLHVSRSLQRTIRRGGFELTFDRAFRSVMEGCAEARDDGTWILPEMVEAYVRLHRMGHAHSIEVWRGRELVGGVYGVQVGALFAAESKFHRRTDMSKVALVALVRSLFARGIQLLDVQFLTEHLASLGAFEVPRAEYLRRARAAARVPVQLAGLVPTLGESE